MLTCRIGDAPAIHLGGTTQVESHEVGGRMGIAPFGVFVAVDQVRRALIIVYLARYRHDAGILEKADRGFFRWCSHGIRLPGHQRSLEERCSGHSIGIIVGQRGSEHHHMAVVGKGDLTHTLRQVDTDTEHIGELIGFVGTRGVAVTAHIRHLGIFHESLGVVVVPPLADKARIERYVEPLGRLSDSDFGRAVVEVGSHKEIQVAVVVLCSPFQHIALTRQTIGRILLAKAERNVAHHDAIRRQQLGGIAIASLEIGRRPERIETEAVAVEGQIEHLALHGRGRLLAKRHLIGSHSERIDIDIKRTAAEGNRLEGALRTIGLHGLDDFASEGEAHLLCLFASHLIDTHHIFVAHLGLFQRTHHHLVVVGCQEGERFTERALVLGDEERTERTVEHVGGAHRPGCVECPLMPLDAVGEHMMSEILSSLIGIAALRLGRIKQREAQRAVIGLVPSIAGVVEQGDAIGPRTVGEVGPLMGIDLEQIVLVVATAHMAQTDVISGFLVGHIQCELGFEQGVERAPVDHVLDIYPVG